MLHEMGMEKPHNRNSGNASDFELHVLKSNILHCSWLLNCINHWFVQPMWPCSLVYLNRLCKTRRMGPSVVTLCSAQLSQSYWHEKHPCPLLSKMVKSALTNKEKWPTGWINSIRVSLSAQNPWAPARICVAAFWNLSNHRHPPGLLILCMATALQWGMQYWWWSVTLISTSRLQSCYT